MSVTPEVPRAGFVSAWIRRPQLLAAACWALLAGPAVTHAADIASAWAQLRQGEYEEVIDEALAVIDDPATPAEWHLLLAEALFTVGRYADAESAAVRGLAREPGSIRLRWVARGAALAQGRKTQAEQWLTQIG